MKLAVKLPRKEKPGKEGENMEKDKRRKMEEAEAKWAIYEQSREVGKW